MANFADIKGHNTANIRKALEMSIFIKPAEDTDVAVTAVYDAEGVLVPEGYVSVGLTTKDDGASWSRQQDAAETTSHGYAEPTRRDITSDVRGLGFTMQETKRTSLELYHGVDLSGVQVDADGNFYFDAPSRPASRKYRVFALGKDGDGPDAIYVARWLPLVEITEQGEQAWNEGAEINYPVTMTGRNDSQFGTSFREVWGGPGLDHVAMGLDAPVTP